MARAGVAEAQSGGQTAQGELAANRALLGAGSEETDPAVLAAKARVAAARLDIGRAVIRAPVGGVVTRRQVQLASGSPGAHRS